MKLVLLLVALTCVNLTYSQTLPNFEEISLTQGADYKPAEPFVLVAANHILSSPVKENDPDRKRSFAFILRWMTGTPDFSFEIDETATKISKGNDEMFGLYLAATAKYGIENPANAKDKKIVRDHALDMVIDYCQKPENNVKMTKGLKKYAAEREKK